MVKEVLIRKDLEQTVAPIKTQLESLTTDYFSLKQDQHLTEVYLEYYQPCNLVNTLYELMNPTI